MSRLRYYNLQPYDLAGRFSVKQRRFGWLLKRHPRAFNRRRGAKWVLQTLLYSWEMDSATIAKTDAELSKQFMQICEQQWNLDELKRRLDQQIEREAS